MPQPEPNKEMEDLLRAYANRRREQGRQELPSELPAASRTRLQNEVRRAFGDNRAPERGVPVLRRLASYWPRLALCGGLAALLILVFRTPVPPASPASTLSVAPAVRNLFVEKSKSFGQQFVQVNTASPLQNSSRTQAPVLANFQMARRGRNVMVYDADGSIYRGTVLEPAVARAGYDSRGKTQDVLRAGVSNAGEELDNVGKYSFQVSGLNNNLKKNVVFTGDVFQTPLTVLPEGRAARARPGAPPASVAQAGSRGFGGQNQNVKSASSQKSAVSNSIQPDPAQNQSQQLLRVTGKVQVGGGGEFEIEAQPPAPPKSPGP
jgi:hypothetical protein